MGESWVLHYDFNNFVPLAGVGRTDAMILSVAEVVIFGIVSGTLAGAVLRATTWARRRRRFLVAGAATAVGFIAWNL